MAGCFPKRMAAPLVSDDEDSVDFTRMRVKWSRDAREVEQRKVEMPLQIMEDNEGEILAEDEDDKRYSSLEEWCITILKIDDSIVSLQNNPTIPKVPSMLRRANFEEEFKPKMVSIGPYHHGNSNLKFTQDLKHFLAKKFMKGRFKYMISMCGKILGIIDQVRKFYGMDNVKHFNDDELMKIMLLDGCFVLYFIFCVARSQPEELGITNDQIELTRQDLFMIENQVPSEVLDFLDRDFHSAFTIPEYISMNIDAHSVYSGKPLHLLDVVRKSIVGDSCKTNKRRKNNKGPMLRNAKELTAVGIYFKPDDGGCISDITFKSCGIYGRLKLPVLTIDNSTKSLLLNLIACEMCTGESSCDISSYVCFLDSMIDNAEDVIVLRSAGIIRNNLNSDNEVAEIINSLCSVLIPEGDTLADVKAAMQNYLENKNRVIFASWLAEVIRKHFRTPLTVFIVLAATLALFLTAVQTYYTVFK